MRLHATMNDVVSGICNTSSCTPQRLMLTFLSQTAQHSTARHMCTLRVVLVRMESLFWADSTLIRRRMSICMVMPCRVVNNTIWLLMVSTAAYMAAMLSKPVLTSGRVHRPAAPGTSPYVLMDEAARRQSLTETQEQMKGFALCGSYAVKA